MSLTKDEDTNIWILEERVRHRCKWGQNTYKSAINKIAPYAHFKVNKTETRHIDSNVFKPQVPLASRVIKLDYNL